jgi:agarase
MRFRPATTLRIVAGLLLLGLMGAPLRAQSDSYGGWLKLKGRKTGFFHTEQIGGRWWFVTPEGNAFFAHGIAGVDAGASRGAAPSAEEAKSRVGQIKGWNFNSVQSRPGALPGIPYTFILGLAASTTPDLWLLGLVPDYFSPAFREAIERRAAELVPAVANDPWLIGFFTDNEVRWFPDIRSKETILETFLKKPPDSPGYQRAMAFLNERGHTAENITWEDKADFLEVAAAQYGRICRDAIRRHDKNHLILGSRFNERAPIALTKALGPYFDVFSFNTYEFRAPKYKLKEMAGLTGKPTLVTEFSFKAMDSGNPNTVGAGEPVATQQDRAELFADFVQDLARLPTCIGFFWFRYRDQPKETKGGRSPGGWGAENSNYGVVKVDGTPWTVLTDRMTKVNAGLETLAAESAKH